MDYKVTRARKAAAEAVCRPKRLLAAIENNFEGILTRSLQHAKNIIKPESHSKKRAVRIRARRQTTENYQPARRVENRVKSMGYQQVARFCTCNGPDIGTLMIECEKPACAIQWYHVACLKEKIDYNLPWICAFCR